MPGVSLYPLQWLESPGGLVTADVNTCHYEVDKLDGVEELQCNLSIDIPSLLRYLQVTLYKVNLRKTPFYSLDILQLFKSKWKIIILWSMEPFKSSFFKQ